MFQGCTKFRVFNVLLLLCVINVLVFRSYFGHGLQSLIWTSGNVTFPHFNTTTASSGATLLVTRALVTGKPHGSSLPDVKEKLDPAGGAGRPLEAWGTVVKPRAKVTAPWSRDNTTVLCPLVPPKLGESEWLSLIHI